jgi:hypothetical protein
MVEPSSLGILRRRVGKDFQGALGERKILPLRVAKVY